MFEYSIFNTPTEFKSCDYKNNGKISRFTPQMSETYNNYKNEEIRFKIRIYHRDGDIISIKKTDSLEDLYKKIYNSVYPEFSTQNNIPQPGINKLPILYHVSMFDGIENFMIIPNHKFISLSSFIKSKPEYFTSISYFGSPMYNVYVIDEEAKKKLCTPEEKKTSKYYQRLFTCRIR